MHRLNKNAYTNISKFLYDTLCILLSALFTSVFSHWLFKMDFHFHYTWIFIVFTPVFLCSMYIQGMYRMTTFFYPDRVVKNVILSCIFSYLFIWLLRPFMVSHFQQDRVLGLFMMSASILLALQNYAYTALLRYIRGSAGRKGIIVGNRDIMMEYLYFINKTSFNTNIIGFVAAGSDLDISSSRCLGKLEDMQEVLNQYIVDEVIFALPRDHAGGIGRYVRMCEERGVTVKIVLDLFDLSVAKTYVHSVGTLPVLTYHSISLNELQLLIKRIMDIIGAIVGILLTSLLSLLIVPAIELDSRGPVLFAQNRVGQNGRIFRLFKFRSMCADAEDRKREIMGQNEIKDGMMFKIKEDPRVTRVGAFLRKTSLDELPQFINVLKGDMSLVGTRPPTPDEVEKYDNAHYRRISIKPGITGLWQISGRSEVTDFNDVVKLDTHYIDNWSVLMDVKIMIKTLAIVFNRKGAF